MIESNEPLEKRIEGIHLPIANDPSCIGEDIYGITDLPLLIEWWKAGQWLDSTSDNSFRTKQLKEFHAALWIQINRLHPKTLLRFQDIE